MRIRVVMFVSVLLALGGSAFACPTGTNLDSDGWCRRQRDGHPMMKGEIWYLQQALAVQSELVAEMKRMSETVANLKTAVDNLNAASTQLKASNDTWRAATLDAAVKKIQDVPAALASNQALVDAVAARLAADTVWLSQVRR